MFHCIIQETVKLFPLVPKLSDREIMRGKVQLVKFGVVTII